MDGLAPRGMDRDMHRPHPCTQHAGFARSGLIAVLVALCAIASPSLAQSIPPGSGGGSSEFRCNPLRHYMQLDDVSRRCTSGVSDIRRWRRQTVETDQENRALVRTITVDALCFYPIPCDYDAGVFRDSITNSVRWDVTVSAGATLDAKLALGGLILKLLGAPSISVSVSINGAVTYSKSQSWTQELEILVNDCHIANWHLFETSQAVHGTIQDVETYYWSLNDRYICGGTGSSSDPYIWCDCPNGTVTTDCESAISSGSGMKVTGFEIEIDIVPCCAPLDPTDPLADPCCGRVCPG